MRKTETDKYGHMLTTYTAQVPYKVDENGVKYYKQLVTWDNSRRGRVVYERKTHIDTSGANYPYYSLKENQVGCGYCVREKECMIRNPYVNKAKMGCKGWMHFEDANS